MTPEKNVHISGQFATIQLNCKNAKPKKKNREKWKMLCGDARNRTNCKPLPHIAHTPCGMLKFCLTFLGSHR